MDGKNGGGIPPVTNKLYMGRMVAMDFLSHCIYTPKIGAKLWYINFIIYLPSYGLDLPTIFARHRPERYGWTVTSSSLRGV